MPLNVTGGALEFDAVIKDSQFDATIRRIESQLQGLTRTAEKEAGAIDNLVRRTAQAIAGYATFAAGTDFIGDIVRVRGEFQQLEVAFSTMLGSKQRADQLLSEITEFAATTPFELKDVAAATKQLLAFGIPAERIKDTLRSLGDVSAGIGAPLGEIAYLFGTIKTQGVALTQDVRQFAQRGIPVYEELAKVLNVSVEEVGKFITAGKVGFPEIEKVFQNLTAQGGKFGGLMEAQSKTLLGQISNLRDAVNQMLNEIGRSNEGVFADAIDALKFLIDNYETVIDILKVLVITYGSYRAAIIATNTVNAIATSLTKGYTVAELLRYNAMLLTEKAQKLLNKTMLANPAVAVATGIGLLVSALVIFNSRASQATRTQELLNEVNADAAKSVVKQKDELQSLLKVAKDETLSKERRLQAVKDLNAISPQYLGNLTLENIKTTEATDAINNYIQALDRLALAKAVENKKVQLLEDKVDLDLKLETARKTYKEFIKLNGEIKDGYDFGVEAAAAEVQGVENSIDALNDLLKKNTEEQLKDDSEKNKSKKRTLAIIDDEIKAEKERQQNLSATSAEYQAHQKKINELEAERKRITGATKSEVKSQQAEENKALALLEKRKDLLEQIAEQVRQASQTSRTKEQTELDKINEKYDSIIDNIVEYNKKVDAFNKKNPKKQIQQIGQVDIVELNKARTTELDNATLRADAERFKKNLDEKQRLFEQYEEAKKQVGIQKANELFAEQTQGYEDFLQLLTAESERLAPKIRLGIANVGDVAKFKAITDQINEYNKKKGEEAIKDEKRKFTELITATATYNQNKAAINLKYDKLEATLRANSTIEEFNERKRILDQQRQEELTALDNDLIRQSDLYKRLNQDIIGFTRERIKEEIKLLRAKLKTDTSLTPQQKADIQGTIDQYDDLLDSTNETAKKFGNAATDLFEVSGIFGNLGSALEGVNDELAEAFENMSQLANIAGNAASAVAQFASGDILAGIGSVVNVITGIFNIGKKARAERKRQQQEVADFLTAQFVGEQQINLLYQERARQQVLINKLRVQGLEDEKKLLIEQRDEVLKNYQTVFDELAKQTAKVLKTIVVPVFGPRDIFVQESLFGKSFEELEQLFLKGQLEGKAKELFEQLQRIKESGVDIDRLLEENKKAAQELFTGTTVDSLVDSIADGFKSGLNSASDFADQFQDLMRNAIIQSLKFRFLEEPLKAFFEEFAAATQSDNALTTSEVQQLQQLYNSIIQNAQAQFDQLQQISGVNLTSGSAQSNSLTGAIRGMTGEQADLLAGQFGGLRITNLQILQINTQQLSAINAIQINTSVLVARVTSLLGKFDAYETGTRRLKVDIK